MILALVRAHVGNRMVWLMIGPTALMAIFLPTVGGIVLLAIISSILPVVVSPQLTKFELTLPVHARVLMQARMLAAGALVVPPLLLWVLSVGVQRPRLWPLEWTPNVVIVAAMAIMLSYLAFGTPRLWTRVSLTGEIRLRLVLLAVVSAGVVYLLPTFVALGVLLIAAVALYFALVRSIPESLALTPAVETATMSRIAHHASARVVAEEISEWRLLRLLIGRPWYGVLYVPWFTLAVAFGQSGNLIFFFGMGVLASLSERRQRLRWLVALPLSHRVRLWVRIGPVVTVLGVGLVAGSVVRTVAYKQAYEISYGGQTTATPNEWYDSPSRVSLEHWSRAAPHTQPVITAPWGESIPADTLTLFGVTRYNSYTSRKTSSVQFIDWQFQRASAVVYGRAFTQAEYAALPERLRPVPRGRVVRAQVYFVSVLATGLLLLMWLTESVRSYRWKNREYAELAGVLFFLAGAMLFFFTVWVDFRQDVDLTLLLTQSVMLHALRVIPDFWPLTLLLATLPVLSAYRLLEWQFARSEIPAAELAVARQAA